ncbi:MucR family transcriptional regulator [Novosphingobium sp. BL-52-GroH]|uniref:MucR family transcriptional regulator n=1 Tax=Novosphingobium sp. BL-52-GroH TaxID=3349877 RepID=UPI00384D94F3
MPDTDNATEVTALTVQLLSAYLSNNTVASTDLAFLIRSTRQALTGDVAKSAAVDVETTHIPAVSVRKSLASPDQILSLIDGKPYKTLKRHLATHGLTPETYRERYNLPASYPMTAPSFAALRREIAEKIGLGKKSAPVAAPVVAGDDVAPSIDEKSQAAGTKGKSAKVKSQAARSKPARTAARKAKGPAGKSDAPEPTDTVTAEIPAQSSADEAPDAAVKSTAPAKAPPRRRKLGLFGKAAG